MPQWYVYVTSRLDTWTGPWTSSAFQTAFSMWGGFLPNCSDYGAASLSVDLLVLALLASS